MLEAREKVDIAPPLHAGAIRLLNLFHGVLQLSLRLSCSSLITRKRSPFLPSTGSTTTDRREISSTVDLKINDRPMSLHTHLSAVPARKHSSLARTYIRSTDTAHRVIEESDSGVAVDVEGRTATHAEGSAHTASTPTAVAR